MKVKRSANCARDLMRVGGLFLRVMISRPLFGARLTGCRPHPVAAGSNFTNYAFEHKCYAISVGKLRKFSALGQLIANQAHDQLIISINRVVSGQYLAN